jgi:hypothetical protein
MIGISASRGLCPCDPRIYRFPASPDCRLRFASTPEASMARLRRVRPRNRRSGRIPALPYPPSGLDQSTPTRLCRQQKSVACRPAARLKRMYS